MFKPFLIVISSFLWIPIILFLLVCVLTVVVAIVFVFLLVSLILLIWLLQAVYRVRNGVLLARQELIKDIGQELNTLSWWRLVRLTWRKYRKRVKEEQIERELRENEKEIEYD